MWHELQQFSMFWLGIFAVISSTLVTTNYTKAMTHREIPDGIKYRKFHTKMVYHGIMTFFFSLCCYVFSL